MQLFFISIHNFADKFIMKNSKCQQFRVPVTSCKPVYQILIQIFREQIRLQL